MRPLPFPLVRPGFWYVRFFKNRKIVVALRSSPSAIFRYPYPMFFNALMRPRSSTVRSLQPCCLGPKQLTQGTCEKAPLKMKREKISNTAPRGKIPAQAQSHHANYEPKIAHSDFTISIAQWEFFQSAIPISPACFASSIPISPAWVDSSSTVMPKLQLCKYKSETPIRPVCIAVDLLSWWWFSGP